MARKKQQSEPEEQLIQVNNRLEFVNDSTRAGNLFGKMLEAVEKAAAREKRETENDCTGS